MECPHCKKDFEAGVKAAYKLGLIEGENRLQTTINCIKITNRRLFNELLRLDKHQPLSDCCIRISRGDAERLVAYLNRHKAFVIAKRIQNALDTQIITEITFE